MTTNASGCDCRMARVRGRRARGPGRRLEGDTALEKTTISAPPRAARSSSSASFASPPADPSSAASPTRRAAVRGLGAGTLELDDTSHALGPDTGAYVRAGERYTIDNAGPDDLDRRLRLDAGAERAAAASTRHGAVRGAAELRADDKRTFRYLVNQDALPRRDAVRRPRRAGPRTTVTPTTRSATSSRAAGSRTWKARRSAGSGFVLPAAGDDPLHREHGARPDADSRRVPPVGRPAASRSYEDSS